MKGNHTANLQSVVGTLSKKDIKEVLDTSDALGMRDAIILWGQFSEVEGRSYFIGDREPKKSNLVPEDPQQKEEFYTAVAKRLVRGWKQDPDNKDKKRLAITFLDVTNHELHFPETHALGLKSLGYHVENNGLVKGVEDTYLDLLKTFATQQNFDLDALVEKIGGCTTDVLQRAGQNLQLSMEQIEFIEDFFVFYKDSDLMRGQRVAELRALEKCRRYYINSGLSLDDFPTLWGLQMGFEEAKTILLKLSKKGTKVDNFLSVVNQMYPDKHNITDAQLTYKRAQNLNLPDSVPSWDEINKRNNEILDFIQELMFYKKITGRAVNQKSLILTGRPGTRTRAVNITYPNAKNGVVNVQMMDSYTAVTKFGPTLAHEITHELHAFLISNYKGGLDVWNNLSSGIKEQFAQLVGSSVQSIYKQKGSEGGSVLDHYPTLVSWIQFPYSYSQLRFLEEVFSKDSFTDQDLLDIEESITQEVHKLYKLKNKDRGQTVDLTKARRAPRNILQPDDGLVYAAADVNSYNKEASDKKSLNQTLKQSQSLEQFMEEHWGSSWIQDKRAYSLIVAAMLYSSECNSTQEVIEFVVKLSEQGHSKVMQYLNTFGIDLN